MNNPHDTLGTVPPPRSPQGDEPAFPSSTLSGYWDTEGGGNLTSGNFDLGLSKRELFAALAMAALISVNGGVNTPDLPWRIADLVLGARDAMPALKPEGGAA